MQHTPTNRPTMTSTVDASTDPAAVTEATECDTLRNALHTKEHELTALCARLQQNNDALTEVVERLERTVSASIDRFVRRLDRMEGNHNSNKRSYDNNAAYNRHNTNCNNNNAKRSKYNNNN